MVVNKLEDLRVWQEARKLANMIYDALERFPESEKYNITKHLKECARSVPGNIAEGFGRFHHQESKQFYRIARGSLEEIKSDLYLSLDRKYIREELCKDIIEQNDLTGKLLNGLIKSTKK